MPAVPTREQQEVLDALALKYGAVRVDRVPPMGAMKVRASVKDRGLIAHAWDVYPDGTSREHREFCPGCAAPPEVPHAESCPCADSAT